MSKILNIDYDGLILNIGSITDDNIPTIPIYQKKKHDSTIIEIKLNNLSFDEYTDIYYILIEVYSEGNDSLYYMFNSQCTDCIIQPLDIRTIPSEFFIEEIKSIFEKSHYKNTTK